MRLELTHFVYLMQEAPVLPHEIDATEALYDPVRRRVSIGVTNQSDKLTRLHSVGLVNVADEETAVEACPLLPRHAREFDLPWSEAAPPRTVRLHFPGFMIERPVRIRPAGQDADIVRRDSLHSSP